MEIVFRPLRICRRPLAATRHVPAQTPHHTASVTLSETKSRATHDDNRNGLAPRPLTTGRLLKKTSSSCYQYVDRYDNSRPARLYGLYPTSLSTRRLCRSSTGKLPLEREKKKKKKKKKKKIIGSMECCQRPSSMGYPLPAIKGR